MTKRFAAIGMAIGIGLFVYGHCIWREWEGVYPIHIGTLYPERILKACQHWCDARATPVGGILEHRGHENVSIGLISLQYLGFFTAAIVGLWFWISRSARRTRGFPLE